MKQPLSEPFEHRNKSSRTIKKSVSRDSTSLNYGAQQPQIGRCAHFGAHAAKANDCGSDVLRFDIARPISVSVQPSPRDIAHNQRHGQFYSYLYSYLHPPRNTKARNSFE
jgi:hypothetical protein